MIDRRATRGGVRWEVRFRAPDGKERSRTFRARKDAERFEREQRAAVDRGSWIDPRHASTTFESYAASWLSSRHDLQPRTVELYESLLRRHLIPAFGMLPLAKVTPSEVRSWNATLAGRHRVAAAKAYRLLREVMNAAVGDELLIRNPCVLKGAGQERSPERPTASIAEVEALTQEMPDHLRLAVLLAAWCQLRRGELIGLERRDFDMLHRTVRVERTVNRVRGGLVVGPPKTEAGRRIVTLPPHILPDVVGHLDTFVGPMPTDPVLVGVKGGRLSPLALYEAFDDARRVAGRPDLHFHDLRHFGATLLAISGATTRELMARVGHSSPVAALKYQHATMDRDAALAEALSEHVQLSHRPASFEASRDIRGMSSELPAGSEGRQSPDQGKRRSGRRGSNPHNQLGRLGLCH
jgi:integrase